MWAEQAHTLVVTEVQPQAAPPTSRTMARPLAISELLARRLEASRKTDQWTKMTAKRS